MRLAKDDHDIGTIVLTVIMTVLLGGLIYAYGSGHLMQSAYLHSPERTVPTIVPNQPRL
jgi:hypothetical protein